MVVKKEIILEHIIDIKEDVAGINQHLKDMNGRLVKNDNQINNHSLSINRMDKRMAYWAGGVTAILGVFSFLINYFL